MRRELATSGVLALTALAGCFLSLKEYPVEVEVEGAGGAGSASGPGGGGTGGAEPASFAERCGADGPCEDGLTCWPETAMPWGPAGGLCTKPCASNADCPGTAHCVAFGYCMEGCSIGDGNANKCAGRRELGCYRYDATKGIDACIPTCSDDADCSASGRICDRGIGMCTGGAHAGKPAGAVCSRSSECRGGCEGVCGELCVVGAPKSCDQSAVSSTVKADCVGSALADTGIEEKVGDLAFCAARCECQSECPLDALECATTPGSSTAHCLVEASNTTPTPCQLQ